MASLAKVEVVNLSVEVPFGSASNNDILFSTVLSNQSLHVCSGVQTQILSCTSNGIGINVTNPVNKLQVLGNMTTSNIFSKRIGLNSLDVKRPIQKDVIYNTTDIQLDGLLESNNNIYMTSLFNKDIYHNDGTSNYLGITSLGNTYVNAINVAIPHKFAIMHNNQHLSELVTYGDFDIYPFFCTNNRSHDNTGILFDAYNTYTTQTDIRSGFVNTNFNIIKTSNRLNIFSFSNCAVGTVLNTTGLQPSLCINSNGTIGVNTSNATSQLTINGDICNSNIIRCPQMQVIQIAEALGQIAHINVPTNTMTTVFISTPFRTFGGTLVFDIEIDFFVHSTATTSYLATTLYFYYTIVNQATNTNVVTFSNVMGLNYQNDHRLCMISKVIGPGNTSIANTTSAQLPAGTYTFHISIGNNAYPIRLDNFSPVNITITELPI